MESGPPCSACVCTCVVCLQTEIDLPPLRGGGEGVLRHTHVQNGTARNMTPGGRRTLKMASVDVRLEWGVSRD